MRLLASITLFQLTNNNDMHIHILGICGTFMGGIAALAKSLGHRVSGCDANVYPPMSTQLEQLGIELTQGFDPSQFSPTPDMVVIGNAMSRGNPAVEYVLEQGLPYTSGPQWLLENCLGQKHVLAVAGTHGKTTTSSMLAWILEDAGLAPGFLIGGIPENFGISARVGDSEYFVMEADEYDSAFFDKRSKFVHYRPQTLVLNNLEFDHADIFEDLRAIQKQFHHLVRTVPCNGLIVSPSDDDNMQEALRMGCWSRQHTLGNSEANHWSAVALCADCSEFSLKHYDNGELIEEATIHWSLIGEHNMNNASMAIAAAQNVGVSMQTAAQALSRFKNVKRRMEVRGTVNEITVYDDFAHHPTAINTTLNGLRNRVGEQKIIAVLEPRSYTMRSGVHKQHLAESLHSADEVYIYQAPSLRWAVNEVIPSTSDNIFVRTSIDEIVEDVCSHAESNTHVLIMSNGGFDGIHDKMLAHLRKTHE